MSKLRKSLLTGLALAGALTFGGGAFAGAAPAQNVNQTPSTSTTAAPQKSAKAAADPQAGGKATALAATCEYPVNVANSTLQAKTITSSDARYYYNDAVWQDLACASLDFVVPRGKTLAIMAHANAELTCTHTDGIDATQWCLGQILINHTPAYPVETPADGSFAWAQSSTDYGAWEANSMDRSRTVRCAENEREDCKINVRAQVKNNAPGLEFRVDGSHFEVQAFYV